MRRRGFIKIIVGSAVAWPLAARAQQRRIGVLSNKRSDDPEGQNEHAVFIAALEAHGWVLGGNLQIDYRWGAGDGELYRTYSAELVKQTPDLLLAEGGTVVGALQRATREIPIVFVETTDPVDRGLVASLSKPGGNTTGFKVASLSRPGGNMTGSTDLDLELGSKLVELLHDAVPSAKTVALLVNPTNFNTETLSRSLQPAARTFGLQLHVLNASTERDFDTVFERFRQLKADGLVVVSDVFFNARSKQLATH